MSGISVASIHSNHLMSHGDYKPQNFLQLASQCMMVIEGFLVEHQFFLLLKDGHSLFSVHIVSQKIYMHVGGSSLDGSLPDALMYLLISLSHQLVVDICSSCQSHSDSIQDRLHSLCIQPQCNSAQGICSCIVPSPFVLDSKDEPCK